MIVFTKYVKVENMLLEKAKKNAKSEEEEKIGLSLKVPKSLKEKIEKEAKDAGVSVNALLTNVLELAFNESVIKEELSEKDKLKLRLLHLEIEISKFTADYDEGYQIVGDYRISDIYIPESMKYINDLIREIEAIKLSLGVK